MSSPWPEGGTNSSACAQSFCRRFNLAMAVWVFLLYFRRDFGLVCIDSLCTDSARRCELSNQSWSVSLGFARCVMFSFLLFFFRLCLYPQEARRLHLIRKRNEKWESKWCVCGNRILENSWTWYAGKLKLLSLPRFFATLHCEPGFYLMFDIDLLFTRATLLVWREKTNTAWPNAHYTLNRKPSRPMQLSEVFNLMFDIDLLLLVLFF